MTPASADDRHGTLPGPGAAPSEIEGLARWIAARVQPPSTLILGINGAQGSGKSTLAGRLRHQLRQEHALDAVVLAIDDFYLTRAERSALAGSIHPLLMTRGVPGTHDVELLSRTLDRLRHLETGRTLRLPRFVKAQDDRAPDEGGEPVAGPVDVVLFEGWCVGTPPQRAADLAEPINRLEADEDRDGRWRRHVNAQLAGPYARVFEGLDHLVFLQAPAFEVVHRWRLEQEAGNAKAAPGSAHVMDADALERFIAHYERLTRHALETLPSRADVVFELDAERRPRAVRFP
jgi:D-glycerate 3-kinase